MHKWFNTRNYNSTYLSYDVLSLDSLPFLKNRNLYQYGYRLADNIVNSINMCFFQVIYFPVTTFLVSLPHKFKISFTNTNYDVQFTFHIYIYQNITPNEILHDKYQVILHAWHVLHRQPTGSFRIHFIHALSTQIM